ncbi:MAG: hypothetical protein ACRENJ_06755 [Candidatus Eiseniibacteriota bacterium]
MPTNKDLKRLIRRRKQKTGESYTAARAQLVKARTSTPRPTAPASPPNYARLAGMSDAAVKTATGCTWKRWVDALDYVEAHTWPHRKIAEYVQSKFKVQDWWAQTVTVGYERIRGLREIGQRRGGSFEATKSRTFAVPVARLFAAFAEARPRARWLPGIKVTVRKATPHRSVRITWEDETSVEVWLAAKGEGRSTAQVSHRKLPSRVSATRTKAYWTERLDALESFLRP